MHRSDISSSLPPAATSRLLFYAALSDGMVSTSEQLSQLEFCSAVFKEVLRLRTPAPLLAFHCTVRTHRFRFVYHTTNESLSRIRRSCEDTALLSAGRVPH